MEIASNAKEPCPKTLRFKTKSSIELTNRFPPYYAHRDILCRRACIICATRCLKPTDLTEIVEDYRMNEAV